MKIIFKKHVLSILLVMALILRSLPMLPVSATIGSVLDGKTDAQISDYLEEYISGAIDACYSEQVKTGSSILGSAYFTDGASSTATDWMAFDIGRYSEVDSNGAPDFLHSGDDADLYLAAMMADMESRYTSGTGKLDSSKATEWHRAILAIAALGGDPTDFGVYNGNPIDLVADGTYSCALGSSMAASLLRQGINGPIFALISKNTQDYPNPQNKTVKFTDATIVQSILERQLIDGQDGAYSGWALSGSTSDPDITAMAMQGLAYYYYDDTVYTYTNTASKKQVSKTVREAMDEAVAKLSSLQRIDGDFASWGTVNVESTVQVTVALTMIGIDPKTDPRFIKDGKTLIDGIMKYRVTTTGGFSHSFTLDPENPTADPGKFNGMANDQATYGLIAYWRFLNGMRNLYDFRPDFDSYQRAELDGMISSIDSALALKGQSGYKPALKQALEDYRSLSQDFKRYIPNYTALCQAIDLVGGEEELTVAATITAIEITTPPTKTTYREMDLFEPDGMVVSLVYDTGTKTPLDPSKYTCTPGGTSDNPLLIKHRSVTIKYFGLSAVLPVTVNATWDGEGTEVSPYLIRTSQGLNSLRIMVNDYAMTFDGKYFVLTDDIDLAVYANWIPISVTTTVANQFKGNFNGNGYSVKNLNITKTTSYSGLFGTLGNGSSVKNLVLQSGQISGAANTGSLAGGSWGAAISNITNYINVTGTGDQTGGIIGGVPNSGTQSDNTVISDCINYGTVSNESTTTSAMNAGGIIGYTVRPILIYNCRNYGDVTIAPNTATTSSSIAGGILGNGSGRNVRIIGCSNTGQITNNTSGTSGAAAGILGKATGGTAATASAPTILESCYNTGSVKGQQLVGGIVGDFGNYNNLKNCYSVGTITATASTNQRAGTLAGNLGTNMSVSSNYYLSGMTAIGGVNGNAAMYTVKTSAELKAPAIIVLLNSYVGEVGYPVIWAQDITPNINTGYPIFISQIPEILCAGDADADGIVTASDVVLVKEILLGLHIPTAAERAAANIDGKTGMSVANLTAIKKILVGIN